MLASDGRVKLGSNDARLAVLELSVFLNAGVSLSLALQSMAGSESPALAAFADGVLRRIEKGHALSRAVEATSGSLGPVALSVIRAGEQTGRLARVLSELSVRMDRMHRNRSQLLSALTYPLGILIVTGLLVFFMATYMLPRFLEAAGPALKDPPWPTLLLIKVSQAGVPLALLGLMALCSIPWLMSDVPAAVRARTGFLFDSPLVGSIGKAADLSRLSADLGLMLDAGMTLDRALRAVQPSDPRMEETLERVLQSICQGHSFAEAISQTPNLPRLFEAFVAVGEETGSLPKLLRAQSEMMEADTELRTADAIRLVEPAAMAILGAVVGFVVLGCFMPIYQLVAQNL